MLEIFREVGLSAGFSSLRRIIPQVWTLVALLSVMLSPSAEAVDIPIDSEGRRIGHALVQSLSPAGSGIPILPTGYQDSEFSLNILSGGGVVDSDALLATGLNISTTPNIAAINLMIGREETIGITFDPPGFDPPVTTFHQFVFDFTVSGEFVFTGASSFPTSLPIDPLSLASPSFRLGTLAAEEAVFSGFRDGELVSQLDMSLGPLEVDAFIQCNQAGTPTCSLRHSGPLAMISESVLDGEFDLSDMLMGAALPAGEITSSTFLRASAQTVVTPEPSTALLIGLGLAGLALRRN